MRSMSVPGSGSCDALEEEPPRRSHLGFSCELSPDREIYDIQDGLAST